MPFGNLGTIWSEIGLDIRKLDAGLMAANLKLATADRTITSFGQRLTNASTKLIMAGGLMVGAVAGVGIVAIKMAADYEKSMRNVNSISKLSEQQFTDISNEVLKLSTRMPQSAKNLADGLYQVASGGFQGAEGMKVLEASAKAASAGLTNTEVAAKGIIATLRAYGYEADRAGDISDTMFMTVKKGILTFEDLSSNIGTVIGVASIADIGFNELSGSIAYMTTKGIDAATATTSLNRLIFSIIDPSEKFAEVLRNAGYESGEMALKQIGLTGVMELLTKASGGSITKLQEMIPEIRAIRAAAALTGSGIDELNGFMEDFKDTTGETNSALAEQEKGLNFQLQVLKNNISAVAIQLGTQYIPKVTSATTELSKFIQEHQKATVAIINSSLAIIGTIGGLMLLGGVVGKTRLGVLALQAAFAKLEYALAGIGISGATFLGILSSIALALVQTGDSIEKYGDKTEEEKKQIYDFSDTIAIAEKTLGKGKNVQDEFTASTAALFTELAKSPAIFDELNPKIVEINKNFEDGIITQDEARRAVIDLSGEYSKMPTSLERFTDKLDRLDKGLGDYIGTSVEAKIATQDNEEVLQGLMVQYDLTREEAQKYAKEQGLLKTATEDSTGAIDGQVQSVDDLRNSFNSLIGTLFDGIDANNELQEAEWAVEEAAKAVEEAIKKYGAGSREAESAQNDLDRANQKVIASFYGVYTSVYTTKEEQEAARKKALEYGAQLVTSGQWGEDAFIEMAQQFGLSGNEIILKAQELGIKLDEATKDRLVNIDVDISEAEANIEKIQRKINSVQGKSVEIITRMITTYAGGGIVKAMAGGGVVGNDGAYQPIMTAASGLNIPQTGRPIPIMAHEYEVVANTSQQKNVADWFWNFINNPPDIKGGGEVTLHIPLSVDGKVLYDIWEKYDLREGARKVK